MLVRVRGKDTENVMGALSDQIQRLPEAMMGTLTWDRGTEMANHKKLTIATDVKVYFFCDPKSPWQRARHQREHQQAAQTVPAQEERPLRIRSIRP